MFKPIQGETGFIEIEALRLLIAGILVVSAILCWQKWVSPFVIDDFPAYTADGQPIPQELRQKMKELHEAHKAQIESNPEVKGVRPAKPMDEKTFRQVLSDLAWGRHRQGAALKAPTPKPPAVQSEEEMRIHQETMRSRLEYCSKNKDKDPSCR